MVEFAVPVPRWLSFQVVDGLKITKSPVEAEEWGKLECWTGILWAFSDSQDVVRMAEEDLGKFVLVLFQPQPGAAQKLVAYSVLFVPSHRSRGTTCISSGAFVLLRLENVHFQLMRTSAVHATAGFSSGVHVADLG